MNIQDNRVATFHYKLTDDNGVLISASPEDNPLVYMHGSGAIIPGLEKELTGKSEGDTFSVTVLPEEGYGEKHEELITVLKREVFSGIDEIAPGMQFQAQDDQGNIQVVTVQAVDGDNVTIDRNHPLAGMKLNFEVTVVSVREASDKELSLKKDSEPEEII